MKFLIKKSLWTRFLNSIFNRHLQAFIQYSRLISFFEGWLCVKENAKTNIDKTVMSKDLLKVVDFKTWRLRFSEKLRRHIYFFLDIKFVYMISPIMNPTLQLDSSKKSVDCRLWVVNCQLWIYITLFLGNNRQKLTLATV